MSEEQAKVLSPEEELAAIRAERAKLAEDKSKREEAEATKQLIAAEKRALAEDKLIAAAEEEHGPSFVYGEEEADGKKLVIVKTDLGRIILKRPHANLFRRFQDGSKSDTNEVDKLVRPALVHPSKNDFDEWLDKQPAILARCGSAVAVMFGTRVREVQGK